MATRWSRPRVLLAAVIAAFACDVDEPSTLEISVQVEPPVEASSFPAQVLVGFDSSGDGFVVFRVGFVCAPDGRFATTVTFADAGGGAAPSVADAWLAPFDGGAPFACGPLPAPQRVAAAAPAGPSRATASLQVVGGCGHGEVRSGTVVFRSRP